MAAGSSDSVIDADHIIGLEFVRNRAVTDAGDHGGHLVALLDEIFLADGIKEALANGDFTEFDVLTVGFLGHAGSKELRIIAIRYRRRNFWKY